MLQTSFCFDDLHPRRQGCDVPLVADIHFQPQIAMDVAEVFEKIRINPGNFVDGRKTFEEYVYDSKVGNHSWYPGLVLPTIAGAHTNATCLTENCPKHRDAAADALLLRNPSSLPPPMRLERCQNRTFAPGLVPFFFGLVERRFRYPTGRLRQGPRTHRRELQASRAQVQGVGQGDAHRHQPWIAFCSRLVVLR